MMVDFFLLFPLSSLTCLCLIYTCRNQPISFARHRPRTMPFPTLQSLRKAIDKAEAAIIKGIVDGTVLTVMVDIADDVVSNISRC